MSPVRAPEAVPEPAAKLASPRVDPAADVVRTELHGLNNALAAALGRIEICEGELVEADPLDRDVLRECLHEAQSGILRARDHGARIAAQYFASDS